MGKHLVKHFADFASICETLRFIYIFISLSKPPCLSAFPPFYGGFHLLRMWSWRESNAKMGTPLFIEVSQLFVDIF
jgi:hypothetical protein